MSKKHLFQLLRIIHFNKALDSLLNSGLEYSQIADLLVDAIANGLVEDGEGKLQLTEAGSEKLSELNSLLHSESTNSWILPEEESRIEKIDKFVIYLPNKNELGF